MKRDIGGEEGKQTSMASLYLVTIVRVYNTYIRVSLVEQTCIACK